MEKAEKKDFNNKLESLVSKPKKIRYNGENSEQEIFINIVSYLSISQRMFLAEDYLDTLFQEGLSLSDRYLQAEYSLILGLLDYCTDIDVSYKEGEDNLNIDLIIASGLWSYIRGYLPYDSIKNQIKEVVKIRQSEKTLASVVESFLGKLPEINIEDLKSVVSQFTEGLNNLEQKVPGIVSAAPKKRGRKPKTQQ